MGEHKERMLRGRLYRDNDPELVAERWLAQDPAGFVHRPDAVREPVGFSGVGTARGREPAVGSSA